MVQNLKQPIKDFESYNICESIDSPDPEDDSCSIAEVSDFIKYSFFIFIKATRMRVALASLMFFKLLKFPRIIIQIT